MPTAPEALAPSGPSSGPSPDPASGQASERSSWRQAGDRMLEVAPGLVTWTLLLAPAWIPLLFGSSGARAVAISVLIFNIYWFLRAFALLYGVTATYRHLREDMAIDWLARCQESAEAGVTPPLDYHHLSIIPTYTEPYHVLERTVQAIVDSNYPKELTLVGVITRVDDKPGWANVAKLRERFEGEVAGFFHIKDPMEPPLVPGKSAAMNWGGRDMVRRLTEMGFDLSRVLVTDLDSDYRVHPQYFAWVSYHHARLGGHDKVIWQPVPFFHNNIWEIPGAVRVMSESTSQWQMYLHSRPHRLVAFSSYTCSLEFVRQVGYWDKDVIPEDSRFYWKAFFRFGSEFSVKGVYLPLYGDSPQSRDYASTHLSQYNQIKRWAWGITDIPYVLKRLFKHPEIPLRLRLGRFANLFFNHLNWIFLPILLLFGAQFPIWASLDYSLTDLGQNLWKYSTVILTTALSTTIVLVFLEHRLLPPKPASWGRWRRSLIYVQFLFYPIIGLMLSVLPALEAHTRLLLGKYLEYRVTEKG
ncbi:MAG: glycosyltransferase family 2 protein [Candidatus Dormibacteraeota bacterium]|nr:glycosyltransferase family 2 protein [Candidatus Dormibacteraeota bacterium]